MLKANDFEHPMWLGIGATWCMVVILKGVLNDKINLLQKPKT
jgi:hypothetical protein